MPDVEPAGREHGLGRLLRAAAMDVGPLRRHRDFRLLFTGQFVSRLGTMLTVVALPYQVYALTRSSLAVGLLGIAQLGPLLLTALAGGALADAVDRRRMVLVTELALALGSAALAAKAALARPQLWLLYVAAGAMAAVNGLQEPSLNAMMPRLVDRDELPAASALQSFKGNVSMIAGPAAGGALVATVGLSATYAIDVATFLVSLLALALMAAMPPPSAAGPQSGHALGRVLEGLRYARSRPELIGTYVVDMVAVFFGMPTALFPAIADGLGGAGVLGLLYAAPAVGALGATITSGWTGRVHRHGVAILLAAGAWGAAITAFGITRNLWIALSCLALAGAADMVSGLFRMTIWNQTIPDELRGRLASIEMMSYMTGPLLGNAESGAVAALAGARFSAISGGVLCVAGVALVAALLPGFRRYDARTEAPAVAA
jgi:MFS family permease